MANNIKSWKGAVEPAESAPSGNELKAWKGAVEPAGAVATTGITFVNSLTRDLVRDLVSNLQK